MRWQHTWRSWSWHGLWLIWLGFLVVSLHITQRKPPCRCYLSWYSKRVCLIGFVFWFFIYFTFQELYFSNSTAHRGGLCKILVSFKQRSCRQISTWVLWSRFLNVCFYKCERHSQNLGVAWETKKGFSGRLKNTNFCLGEEMAEQMLLTAYRREGHNGL